MGFTIVVVRKSDGSIRLCGDYKVTINEYLENIEYPTPNAQDLFATLAGGRRFTRLDLKQAYQQMEVDTGSQPYLTINTRKGCLLIPECLLVYEQHRVFSRKRWI